MTGIGPLRDPAAAIAASRCLAARVRDPERWLTSDHPSRCGWCDYPRDVLDQLITAFHTWSGWSERRRTFAHHELRVWAELRAEDQRARIRVAQDLVDEPPPAPRAAAPMVMPTVMPIVMPAGSRAETLEDAAGLQELTGDAMPPRPDWAGGQA